MPKRICKLTDKTRRKNVDLRDYSQTIIDIINKIAPNKNPVVEEHSFSTNVLTQSESVRIGFALAQNPEIAKLGTWVQTFRLFDGRIVKDKKEKQNDCSNNKKVSNYRRNSTTILTSEQKKNKSIGEAIS